MSSQVGAIPLDATDLSIAAGLVFLAGLISLALRLGQERRLLLASVRTVVQLLMIGYVLTWVFANQNVLVLCLIVAIMVAAAGHAAINRSARSFRGAYWRAFLTLALTGILTTFTVTAAVVRVSPWYDPQYVIPLLGMVLGNGLTGISLCMDQLLERLSEGRALVEMELSLGATKWEAARDNLRAGVRRGMIPIINSMMVAGIVALPGMMTGQILAGADPLDAVKYQIVVMFMLAGGTALGCITIALLIYRRLFNDCHQLDWEKIFKRKG